jgi:hypothetical protein
MKYILFLSILFFTSCSIQRYNAEGVNLKPGEISKDHTRCTLVSVKLGQRGYRHLFVTDKSDTLVRYYNVKMQVDSCYYINTKN